ncbi:acyltransferase family protein [Flavobacterium sp.]|uniref:acyltransferase family protein n=1 Tax=Flavobacterium sp. TaxID=239 RepID=UPI002FDA258D
MENNQLSKRIFGLDLMRALAILMVVFGHCIWVLPPTNGVLYQLLAFSSFFGVEIFFVLSGFLIGKILYQLYLKNDFSARTVLFFLKRRWFRTLPNYYLILLVNILISAIIGNSILALWKYFVFLQNFNTSMLPFFTESWSLSVEEYAYVVLPIFLLFVGSVIKPKHKSRFFLVAVLILILIFLGNKMYYQQTTTNTDINQWNVSLKPVVMYRLDSIFMGVLCSWIYANFTEFWQKSKRYFFVLGTFVFLFLFIGIGHFGLLIEKFPRLWNVFYLPIVSSAVACFLPFLSEWKTEKTVLSRPVTFVSVISYSIYLLHYGVVLQLLKHYFPIEGQTTLTLCAFLSIYLVITFVLSSLLYRFYEKPMMDLRDKNQ